MEEWRGGWVVDEKWRSEEVDEWWVRSGGVERWMGSG